MLAYDSFLRDRGGACLLAVCRGKVGRWVGRGVCVDDHSQDAHSVLLYVGEVQSVWRVMGRPVGSPPLTFSFSLLSSLSCVCVYLCLYVKQVSEGMDFADHRARAVIVTGIPFAPAKDPKARIRTYNLICQEGIS